MSPVEDRRVWDLRFTVEIAATYHDWRRGSLGRWVQVVRAIALVGALISIVVVNSLEEHVALVITIVGALTGIVIIVDLVFGFDRQARTHDELFRRCKELQARMFAGDRTIAELEADAQLIWRDEPPILWAIYAKCWNQIVTRYETEVKFKKRVGFWARVFGGFIQFTPQDFETKTSIST